MARRGRRRAGRASDDTTNAGQVPQGALDAFMALAVAIEAGRPGLLHRLVHPMSGLGLSLEGWQLEGLVAEGAVDLRGLVGPGWEGGVLAEGLALSSDGERALLELSPAKTWTVKDLPLGSVACMARGRDGRWLYLWSRIGSPAEGDRLDLEAGLAPEGPSLAFEGFNLDSGHDCVGLLREWPSGRHSLLQCMTCGDHGMFDHLVHTRVSTAAMDEMVEVDQFLGGEGDFLEALGEHLDVRADQGLGPMPLFGRALNSFGVCPPGGPWQRLEANMAEMARKAVDLHVILEDEPRIGVSVVLPGDRTLGETMVSIAEALCLPLDPVGWVTVRDPAGLDHGQNLCPHPSQPVGGLVHGTSLALEYVRDGRDGVTLLAGVGGHPLAGGGTEKGSKPHEVCGDCEVMRPASGYCLDCGAWLCGGHVWEHIKGRMHTTVRLPRPGGGGSPLREGAVRDIDHE